MVDRAYKRSLPEFRATLERLRREFDALQPSTDWGALRIRPLLAHVRTLERLARSPTFSKEFARLRRGVDSFHSDLVYLQTNARSLRTLLEVERARLRAARRSLPSRSRRTARS